MQKFSIFFFLFTKPLILLLLFTIRKYQVLLFIFFREVYRSFFRLFHCKHMQLYFCCLLSVSSDIYSIVINTLMYIFTFFKSRVAFYLFLQAVIFIPFFFFALCHILSFCNEGLQSIVEHCHTAREILQFCVSIFLNLSLTLIDIMKEYLGMQ